MIYKSFDVSAIARSGCDQEMTQRNRPDGVFPFFHIVRGHETLTVSYYWGQTGKRKPSQFIPELPRTLGYITAHPISLRRYPCMGLSRISKSQSKQEMGHERSGLGGGLRLDAEVAYQINATENYERNIITSGPPWIDMTKGTEVFRSLGW